MKPVLQCSDRRALRHPRFFYFAVNTLLRNKAVRGKSFFVNKNYGAASHEEYTPDALLAMSKTKMSRMLQAYTGKKNGSAAERLSQRTEIEAMLNQVEVETLATALGKLPGATAQFRRSVDALAAAQTAQPSDTDSPASPDAAPANEAHRTLYEDATGLLDRGTAILTRIDHAEQPAASQNEDPEDVRKAMPHYARLLREVEQGGEVPAHFVTLTTAIYHWDDLAAVLGEYERCTTALRHGRSDHWGPGKTSYLRTNAECCSTPGLLHGFAR